jgi:hypothetical protein
MSASFGARVYQSSQGTVDGFQAHSEYWADGSVFRLSTAFIIVGAADCNQDTDCLVPWHDSGW